MFEDTKLLNALFRIGHVLHISSYRPIIPIYCEIEYDQFYQLLLDLGVSIVGLNIIENYISQKIANLQKTDISP